MNLYQTFRLSLYLLVASAAASLGMVSANYDYFYGVVIAGALAFYFIDFGRLKPMRPIFAAMLSVVLLLYYVTPAIRQYTAHDSQGAAARMAQFLIMLQLILFFAQFRGSALFAFCGSSLFVVVVSGVLDSGPSLLLRLAIFLGLTTWTLFIHSLWKQRERFRDSNGGVEAPSQRENKTLGELSPSAFWQGQRLTAAVTVLSLFLGFVLFFFWPRSNNSFFSQIGSMLRQEKGQNGEGPEGKDPLDKNSGIYRFMGSATATGAAETVRLDELDDIQEDHHSAVSVTLDRQAREISGQSGLLYLRARSLSRFENNSWFPPKNSVSQWPLDANDGVEFPVQFPHFLEPLGMTGKKEGEARFMQEVNLLSGNSPTYFTLGPPRRLTPPKSQNGGVATDEEGTLLTSDGRQLEADDPQFIYTLYASLPPREDLLPANAKTVGPLMHYRDWDTGFANPSTVPGIKKLVTNILATYSARTDLDKARALRTWLRDTSRYTYTLKLSQVERGSRDCLQDFLLGTRAEQRRGHCGYFATAYVILARAAGLPARMAIGYSKHLDLREASSKIVVFKNSEAHAWTEIFFENFGWVPFDATPGQPAEETDQQIATNPGQNPQNKPGTRTTTAALPTGPPGEKGVVDKLWSKFMSYDRSQQREMYSSLGVYLRGFTSFLNNAFSGGSEWGVAGAVVLWLVMGGIAGWLLLSLVKYRGGRRDKNIALTPRARAAVDFYNELLQLLARRGFNRRDGQTPREFAEAVIKRGGVGFGSVRTVTDVFELVRYGGIAPDESQLQLVKGALQELREKITAKPEK